MIAFLRGRVAAVSLTSAVIDVGGVGYEVLCAPGTLAGLREDREATLATSMVVREDSMTLYGFADAEGKALFELVQTASGVGPKLAQAMLAVLSPDGIRTAIGSEDATTLTKVPGIGKKGAQRIILELKDRVGEPVGAVPSAAGSGAGAAWRDQVTQALVGLGYSAKDADQAIAAIADQAEDAPAPDISALLRAALRTLSKA